MLIEAWYYERVWNNKRKFKTLGNKTYDKFVEAGYKIEDILENIDYYEDHNHIVDDLINRHVPYTVIKFRWLNKETFKKILWLNHDILHWTNEHTFVWLDKESFVEILNLITPSNVMSLKKTMKRFSWLDKESFLYVRNMYSEMNTRNWGSDVDRKEFINDIIGNIKLFKWLDEEVAELLINNDYWYVVVDHPERFWLKKWE